MMDETKPQLRHMAEQLARLIEVSITLNSTLNLDDLLKFIIETAADILDCESVMILLYDESHGRLGFAAATGSDPRRLAEIPIPLENSLAGEVFLVNKAIILSEMRGNPKHFDSIAMHVGFKVNNVLGVPMRVRTRPTGVLEALNKRKGAFDEGDADILSVI